METWRDVPGYESRYQVSDLGRVRGPKGKVLKPASTPYAHVNLGKGSTHRIHNLVLLAFVGPCPVGLEALHRDGSKANNTLANLRYGTHSENHHDITRHGKRKLRSSEVQGIRARFENYYHGFYAAEARRHAVSSNSIKRIVTGEAYSRV